MRSPPHHPGRVLLVLLALLVVMATAAVETMLHREETRAHGALRGAVSDFDEAARQAVLASRLAPLDAGARAESERALDLALIARARRPLRLAALASAFVLGFLGLTARARRHREARRRAWVEDIESTVVLGIDGREAALPEMVPLTPETDSVVVDVFLRPRTAGRRPPRPGPTLSVVLSHAASSTSLRLTPQHDVRSDAVRVRWTDATIARLLSKPRHLAASRPARRPDAGPGPAPRGVERRGGPPAPRPGLPQGVTVRAALVFVPCGRRRHAAASNPQTPRDAVDGRSR